LTLVAIAVFNCGASLAESRPAAIDSSDRSVWINPLADVLIDPMGTLTLDEAIKSDKYISLQLMPYQGYSTQTYWIRARITATGLDGVYLWQKYHNIGSITVYYPTLQGFANQVVDEKLPYFGRKFGSPDFIFRIPSSSDGVTTTTIYVRFEQRGHLLSVDLTAAGEKGAIRHIQNVATWQGVFFGTMTIMWLYNLVLCVFTRNKAYLYYCYYLACFVLTFVDLQGFSSLTFNIPYQWQGLFVVAIYAAVHGVTLFARQFLELDTTLPRVSWCLRNSKYLLGLGVLSVLILPVGHAYRLSVFAILVLAPILLYAAIRRWRHQFSPSKWFIISWLGLAVAEVVFCFEQLGKLTASPVTSNFVQAGAIWEAVFFSLALGYRIKVSEAEATLRREESIEANRRAALISEQAGRDRITFLGMVSHELRSPLQSIISALDVLELRAVGKDGPEYIARIRRASLALSSHLRDLLTIAQGDAGRLELVPERFEVRELFTDFVNSFRGQAATKELLLIADLPVSDHKVFADQSRILQVANTLVSNAIRYTNTGMITVKVEVHAAPDYLEIQVRDTGIGIPSRFLPNIFAPYARFAQLNQNREGSGLGLAIVKTLVTHLGGEISVESQEGVGTAFTVKIPVTQDLSGMAELKLSQEPSEGLVVLVVDDRTDILQGLASVIEEMGLSCDIANSAAAGANALASRRYDLALIDLEMPHKPGVSLAAETRRGGGVNASTILIAFSASSNEHLAKGWPFDGFLPKPVTKDILLALLQKHFSACAAR